MDRRQARVISLAGLAGGVVVLMLSLSGSQGVLAGVTSVVDDDSTRITWEKRWDRAQGGQWSGATKNSIGFSLDSDAIAKLTFMAKAITYVYRVGPDGGIAEVKVKNETTRIDQCATIELFQVKRTFNTGDGDHEISVRNTGASSPACGGTRVTLDAFELLDEQVGPTPELVRTGRYEEGDFGVQFVGVWDATQDPMASGGAMRVSNHRGSFVSLFFNGLSANLIYQTGPTGGIVNVEDNGYLLDVIDTYSPVTVWQVSRPYNVADTNHTLTIRVTDTRNAMSAGTRFAFDALVISREPITPTAVPTSTPIPTATSVPVVAAPPPPPPPPPAPPPAPVPVEVQPPSPPAAPAEEPGLLQEVLSTLLDALAAINARLDALEARLAGQSAPEPSAE